MCHDGALLWADHKKNRPVSRHDTGRGWDTVCECGRVSEGCRLNLHPLAYGIAPLQDVYDRLYPIIP